MKVTLVVASGAHQGKVIPITGPQFLIGRDPQCHLRPASQAISKQHCGILVRDGKVYVKDFGSTNGTTVNGALVKDAEVPVEDGGSVKLGPLDFTVRIETAAPKPDGTPLPTDPEAVKALAAVKAVAATAPKAAPPRDTTPAPNPPAKPTKPGNAPAKPTKPDGSKEAPALSGSKEAAALTGSKEAAALKAPKPAAPPPAEELSDNDRMAAMLLGMDDDVPDGSTVTDIVIPPLGEGGQPAQGAEQGQAAKPEDKNKKPTGGKAQTREDMSNAAQDILRQMMRRPK